MKIKKNLDTRKRGAYYSSLWIIYSSSSEQFITSDEN